MARVAPADDLLIGSLVSSYWVWLGGTLKWWFRKKSPCTGCVLEPLLLLAWGPRKAVCALDPSLLFLKPGMGLAFGSFYFSWKCLLSLLIALRRDWSGPFEERKSREKAGNDSAPADSILFPGSSDSSIAVPWSFSCRSSPASCGHLYRKTHTFLERRPLTVLKQWRNKNLLSIVLLLVGVDGKIWTHHLLR